MLLDLTKPVAQLIDLTGHTFDVGKPLLEDVEPAIHVAKLVFNAGHAPFDGLQLTPNDGLPR